MRGNKATQVVVMVCLALVSACELSPIDVDTGTLENLRILSADFVQAQPLRFEVTIADGRDNPRSLSVRATVCFSRREPSCVGDRAGLTASAWEVTAIDRLNAQAWRASVDVEDSQRDGTLVVFASDGQSDEELRLDLDSFGDAELTPLPAPEIRVDPAAGQLTATLPPDTSTVGSDRVRWFVNQALVLDDRSGREVTFSRAGQDQGPACVYALRIDASVTRRMRLRQLCF